MGRNREDGEENRAKEGREKEGGGAFMIRQLQSPKLRGNRVDFQRQHRPATAAICAAGIYGRGNAGIS